MIYFILLPLFALWLVLAAGATALTRFVPQLKELFPYVWRISLWATLGCIVANATLIWLVGSLKLLPSLEHADPAYAAAMGVALLASPLVAAGAGWLIGAVLGAFLGFMHGRRRSTPTD